MIEVNPFFGISEVLGPSVTWLMNLTQSFECSCKGGNFATKADAVASLLHGHVIFLKHKIFSWFQPWSICFVSLGVFNRPGETGAVLQTPFSIH